MRRKLKEKKVQTTEKNKEKIDESDIGKNFLLNKKRQRTSKANKNKNTKIRGNNNDSTETKKIKQLPNSEKKKKMDMKKDTLKIKIKNIELKEKEDDENDDTQSEKKERLNTIKKRKGKRGLDEINKIDKLVTKDSSGSNDSPEKNSIEHNDKNASDGQNRIYIKGIKSSFTEKDIRDFFKNCGKIINLHINDDVLKTTKEKNIYIDFDNQESVNSALKKNGVIFKGEKIIISKNKENDINIEESQKNISEYFNKMKEYIDEEIGKISNQLNTTKEELNKTKKTFRKKIKTLKIKLGLTNAIMNQMESYNNKKNEYLDSKINALINSFKVLYIRKLSNLLLEKLIKKYNKQFTKTDKIFGKKVKFGIIVADKNIGKIPYSKINLLIDFLKHIKKIASQIVHFNNLKYINYNNWEYNKIQKETFFELLQIYTNKKGTNKPQQVIETKDIIDVIFSSKNESEGKESIENEIKTELEKKIDEYIESQEYLENESEEESEDEEVGENYDDKKEIEEEDEEEEEEEDNYEHQEESDESEDIFNEEKLEIIMLGKDKNSNIKISDLLKALKDKTILNKKNKKLSPLRNNEITPDFLYNSWKKSFDLPNYKRDHRFKRFVNFKENPIDLKDMEKIVKKLLSKEKFYFFQKDPDNFENLIERKISC